MITAPECFVPNGTVKQLYNDFYRYDVPNGTRKDVSTRKDETGGGLGGGMIKIDKAKRATSLLFYKQWF
jgi:hypothetical protein